MWPPIPKIIIRPNNAPGMIASTTSSIYVRDGSASLLSACTIGRLGGLLAIMLTRSFFMISRLRIGSIILSAKPSVIAMAITVIEQRTMRAIPGSLRDSAGGHGFQASPRFADQPGHQANDLELIGR